MSGSRTYVLALRVRLSVGGSLLFRSSGDILLAVIGVGLIEAFCSFARGWFPDVAAPLFVSPPSELSESVLALVGGSVAIGATLLGLYYTTVGVVASTIYRSVAGDVRDLFVRERTSETYLRVVVATVATGVVVLTAGALGYRVAGLALTVLGLLAAWTSIGLVVVAKHLFEYFDPSKLSGSLVRQIMMGIRLASGPRSRGIVQRQAAAHYSVFRALATYRNLVDMLNEKEFRNAGAAVSLTRQILGLLRAYSSWKYAIPTKSAWWARVPQHRNWLTIDHNQLRLSLETAVGVAPEQRPDFHWFERALAQLLRDTLRISLESQRATEALRVSDDVATLVAELAYRFQIDEASILEEVWDRVALDVIRESADPISDSSSEDVRLAHMAAAEGLVRPLTMMLIGLARGAEALASRELSKEFARAVTSSSDLYRGTLPTGTRTLLEGFSEAIAREIKSEGRRVTPAWWVDHYAARSLLDSLLATEDGVVREVRKRAVDQVDEFVLGGHDDLAAVAGMASLELLHKLDFHLPLVRQAELALSEYQNSSTSSTAWPSSWAPVVDAAAEKRALLAKLAILLPRLRKDKFDPREPDLYGQLYQFVVHGAFEAIIEGDDEQAEILYGAVLMEMDSARIRVAADLTKVEDGVRAIYAVEPAISAMDLAGYAFLKYELDGEGVWPQIRALWDGLLTRSPGLPSLLSVAACVADDVVSLTPGGLERSRRAIAFNKTLQDRGLLRGEPVSSRNHGDGLRGLSPVARAAIQTELGVRSDLYSLFVVEVLSAHVPLGTDTGRGARLIADQIAWYAAHSAEGVVGDE